MSLNFKTLKFKNISHVKIYQRSQRVSQFTKRISFRKLVFFKCSKKYNKVE